jgi:nitrogenase subunit NifH
MPSDAVNQIARGLEQMELDVAAELAGELANTRGRAIQTVQRRVMELLRNRTFSRVSHLDLQASKIDAAIIRRTAVLSKALASWMSEYKGISNPRVFWENEINRRFPPIAPHNDRKRLVAAES